MHTHHHHDHAHPHGAPKDFGRAFVIAITLNLGFTAVEFVYGFLAQSSALMADAGHNLSDVLGLAMAGVGLSTNLKIFRGMGMKPFYIGLIAAISVGAVSLLLISLFGDLVQLAI